MFPLGWSAGGFGLMLRWGEVLVSTATPPTVRPQHLNIPKGQVLHTEDTLQEMQKHKTGRFQCSPHNLLISEKKSNQPVSAVVKNVRLPHGVNMSHCNPKPAPPKN